MSDAGGCEVRYYWGHHAKLSPIGGNFYMDFGTLVHTGMAYHYAAYMDRKPDWFKEHPDVQSAMEEDSLGNSHWLQTANEIMVDYKRRMTGSPWVPLYNEEEFEARLGDVDPDGLDEPSRHFTYESRCTGTIIRDFVERGPLEGESIEPTSACYGMHAGATMTMPCPNLDENGDHIPHVVKMRGYLPRLDDEIVTCRPDLIIIVNGKIYIVDHKTTGGDRKGTGRLKVIDPRYPDYMYYWQAMVNLHIVRKGRCVDLPDQPKGMDVEGFIFNRIKRDSPYDVAQDFFEIPAKQYKKVPNTMRQMVRKERALIEKCYTDPSSLTPYHWECKSNWTCDFAKLCYTDSLEERNSIIRSEFF